MSAIPTARLPSGEAVPTLGQGTYRMGEDPGRRRSEIGALRLGIELGMRVIDTAEMYASGGAERVVGAAIAGRREEVFLVSKFLPDHATPEAMTRACERSLRRLGTDRIDLYLLHWRGRVPLGRTLEGFDRLLDAEKVRYVGVSNFDASDLDELFRLRGGKMIATNQVLYNLERRGVEADVLPWLRRRHRPLMAYSPLEEGLLSHQAHPALAAVAARHGATAAQIALAWLLRQGGVIAIVKSARPAHVRENRRAAQIKLTKRDLEELDESFPPPSGPQPLATR